MRLYAAHDLDNYLLTLVRELTKRTGRSFACVWGTKRHANQSFLSVSTAVPSTDPCSTYTFNVTTNASAEKVHYKRAVRDQVGAASPLPGTGVALQLAFVVGPQRARPNLWKPTIDALGSMLGHDDGASEWNPRDGRITDLGLHVTIDPNVRHAVSIAVRASQTPNN
jgi:hypothetical protein